jgi:hypothetical protein
MRSRRFFAGVEAPPPIGAAQPFPDLAVTALVPEVNEVERLFCLSADITNLGTAPPGRHFQVRLDIITDIDDAEVRRREFFWFAPDTPFPLRTPQACLELAYVDENGSLYLFEAVVDPNGELVDLDRSNNQLIGDYAVFSPDVAASREPFGIETRIKDGKRTTTRTLGGKPLG